MENIMNNITVSSEFNVGDYIYAVELGFAPVHDLCPVCHGTGKITISSSNEKINCSNCHGNGYTIDPKYYLSKKFNCEVNKCQVFLPLSK
jgi:excinuclease UvrABC ATPase subunit